MPSMSKLSNSLPAESAVHQFWQQHMDGLNASHFPPLPSHLTKPRLNSLAEHGVLSGSGSAPQEWSNVTLCRAALAVLLSGYTNSPEVIFGVAVKKTRSSGKKDCFAENDTTTPTALAPIRVLCAPNQPLSDVMGQITVHNDALSSFEDGKLGSNHHNGEMSDAVCEPQTVLLATDGDTPRVSEKLHGVGDGLNRVANYTDRALVIDCQMTKESTSLVAHYDDGVVNGHQIDRLLRQLGCLIHQFQSFTTNLPLVGELEYLTPEDQTEIQAWNSEPLEALDTTIHGAISQKVAGTPDAAAVMAWDGEWTYAELDNMSSRLAVYLLTLDLDPEQKFIPLCFEKSKWVVVAMLAVLKAGRAFALIDPNDPPTRMTQICRKTGATVALTSKAHTVKLSAIVPRCIVVHEGLLQFSSTQAAFDLPTVRPQDLAYAIFTSGSTGQPKGNAIEHRGFATCAAKFGPLIGMNRHTRALQFASYAFGACLVEIITTLMHGGCVCIPSDDDRMNNVPGYIKRCNVNWMVVATSYLGVFQPDDVSGLHTLVAGGEPMSASARDAWASRVQLINVYGQSESSTISSVTRVTPCSLEPTNIGRGVGSRLWIIDPNNPDRLAPVGCVGELVIESPGIARGCITDPALPLDGSPFITTTPAWYPPKLAGGHKFYRTGDLARYSSDGSVVCLGRGDSQIKIRGQRIEMSEVETRLRQLLPTHIKVVAEAIKRSDKSHTTVLIAFLIEPYKAEDTAYSVSSREAHVLNHDATNVINTQLYEVLPKQSIPSHYIRMEELPRTATGKVNRRVLRSVASKLVEELVHNEISEPLEDLDPLATSRATRLRETWLACLNLNNNARGVEANFFELGGDSIAAIKMVNMARAAGIELTVSTIFQNPTLAGLVKATTQSPATYNPIPKSTYTQHVEQSFAQGRLWFLDQLEVGASWYLIPYGVRMRGPLNREALTVALLALEQRHETLRTTFEERGGSGQQIIHPGFLKELKVIDLADAQSGCYLDSLEREQTMPFNLASEAGWRVSLLSLGRDDHILSIVMHHIISDGWSVDVLRRELSQFYSAALRGLDPLTVVKPLPIHYRDFSVWQKLEEQETEHQRQLDYWSKQLADSSPAEFLTDLARPSILTGKAGSVPVVIEGDLYAKLRKFCELHGLTFFSVLLAAFRATHFRLTGAEDSVIGSPIANRSRSELENIIGFFVNTQCLRIAIDDGDTFESIVRQVHLTVTAALEHQDVPFERVVSALLPGSRDVSRNPLAQVIFAMHSQKDLRKFDLEGLETEPVSNHIYTRFDMELHLFQETGSVSGYMAFAEDLFQLENVQNVVSVFNQILRHGLDQPQTPIAVLPVRDNELNEPRVKELIETKKPRYPRESSVVDVFRSQVAIHPDAIAVVDSSSRLTYNELNNTSDKLATWLRRRNMAAETPVGVFAARSCETVVAILGILKANLAYLPLDVKCPAARLVAIFSTLPDSNLILVGSDVKVPDFNLPSLEPVQISEALRHDDPNSGGEGQAVASISEPLSTSLAYVIFTSGSTGKPKGVMTEHRAIVRLAKGTTVMTMFPSAPKMAHVTNLAFDVASGEMFMALLNGGTLVCIDYMTVLDSSALEIAFAQEEVNVALMTPALLKHCLASAPATLRRLNALLVAGDRFDPQDATAARHLIPSNLCNAYGPTENGILSTIYAVTKEDEPFLNGVPIGEAIESSGAFVMDPKQQLVPSGVMGELVVTGDGLARGYTDPELNTDRFVKINLDGKIEKAYRTGDRVRRRIGDGKIEFFGRMDQQIKIRGHRIEIAEVERAVLSQNSVHDAVVVVRDQQGQDPEMVGFVVTKEDNVTTQQSDEADNQVQGWQDLFETSTYTALDTISQSATGNDFTGWTSSYDGTQLDKSEMQEWLDDAIHTLLDKQKPGNVFEIGTGTGMILFNLGPGLQSYVGLEPSKSATSFVNKAIDLVPTLAGKAKVHVGTATDMSGLQGLRPDLVVINSVVQYFPTPEYLLEVVDALIRMPGVRRIHFGDIRSNATSKHFLAARAVHSLGEEATKDEVVQKMSEIDEREEEMLVDPAFFTALQRRLPHLIKHVEIIPKNMRATNELSAYRYAAVIRCNADEELGRPVAIHESGWVDFHATRMDREALLDLLQRSKDAETVAISNISYSKTIFERHIVEALESGDKDEAQNTSDGAAWISAVRVDAGRLASLDVPDLIQLGRDAGFRVEVSAARQGSQHGALDAIFHRYESSSRVLFKFPTDDETRQNATLVSRPLQSSQSRRVVSKLREKLQLTLPSYMVPSRIIAIDKMPVNTSGKVDRKELTRRAKIVPKSRGGAAATVAAKNVAPLNSIEAILCEEFEQVFGMKVGATDHFFNLGGHSLLATKLISLVSRRLNVRIFVKEVFDNPVIADLAVSIRRGLTLNEFVVPAASSNGNETQAVAAVVPPRNELEVVLCEEFAEVLGFEVGITDHFFELGGHSLMATRLAARLGHRLHTTVSVKDIFDLPIIVDLANKIGLAELDSFDAAGAADLVDHAPFKLLPMEDPEAFVRLEICPKLEYTFDMISDVYASTQTQSTFLMDHIGKPIPPTPFYFDFPVDSDCARLTKACRSLVEYVDVFRTVFVLAQGDLYQVVLKQLHLDIEIVETEENVNTSAMKFLEDDLKTPLVFGKPLIRIAILMKKGSFMRVILQLSHALYDGLSLEHIVQTLHVLYNGTREPDHPKFPLYMQHLSNSREGGYEFWRTVLEDSKMLKSDCNRLDVESQSQPIAGNCHAIKVVDVPLLAKTDHRITAATIFTTASALALSKDAGSDDVLFGRIVSGRQGMPLNCQNIIGPCTNVVPVRARVNTHANNRDLLYAMQDQYLSSIPFETLGFEELKRNCTDWPKATSKFGCCIVYQQFDYRPSSQVDGETIQIGNLVGNHADSNVPIHDLLIGGEVNPEARTLQVTIVANRQVYDEARVKLLLDDVCDKIASLIGVL